jgi:methyl-accepting chemotaxis protein
VVAAALQGLTRSVAGTGAVARNLDGTAAEVARALEEKADRRHLDSLERVDRTVGEVARSVQAHLAAARRLRESLHGLTDAAGQHESAVGEVSRLAERLGEGAKHLSDSLGRFRI